MQTDAKLSHNHIKHYQLNFQDIKMENLISQIRNEHSQYQIDEELLILY